MGTTYYFLPTRNLFGEDSVKETGSLMQSLGGKKNSHCNRRISGKTGNGPDGSGYLKRTLVLKALYLAG